MFLRRNKETFGVLKLLKNEEDERTRCLHRLIPQNSVKVLYADTSVLITEFVQPANARIKSLADLLGLLKEIPMDMLMYVLYQLFAMFFFVHTQNPSFAHNDCKVDNILLTTDLKVVLIDAETCGGHSFPPVAIQASPQILEEFGLSHDMPWSQWTDMHLILLEVWTQIKRQRPSWSSDFLVFLSSILPMSCMKTFAEHSVFVSSQNRLNRKGREFLSEYSLESCLQCNHFHRYNNS